MPEPPGKYIGQYTAKGIATEGADGIQKIPLYDGQGDTAYQVTDFRVWPVTWNNDTNPDVVGKLSKNPDGVTSEVSFMRADDNNQVAWSGMNGLDEGGADHFSIVDPDNLIVEDLYVYVRTAGNQEINYLVVMDKYEIDTWKGALTMARDRAQGDIS